MDKAALKHMWYLRNRQAHIDRAKKRQSKKREHVVNYKMSNPTCLDCGIEYPYYILDFDHLPQFEKSFELKAAGSKDKSIEQIDAEIAKCELVCANCHRHRGYIRNLNR